MYRTDITIDATRIPMDLISSAVAQRCFSEFPSCAAFDHVLSSAFATALAEQNAQPTPSFPWAAHHTAVDVAVLGHLLDRSVPSAVTRLLANHPAPGSSWGRVEFKALAAHRLGVTQLDDAFVRHVGRETPLSFGVDVAVFDSVARGHELLGLSAIVELLLGLGWSESLGPSPALSLLAAIIDPEQLSRHAPTVEWRAWFEGTRCPFTQVTVENGRRDVTATITASHGFDTGDLAAACTLLHVGDGIKHAVQGVRFDGRSWPSWTRKLEDPDHGLVVRTAGVRGPVSQAWAELGAYYFRWLLGALRRINVAVARVRWLVEEHIACDVSLEV